MSEDTAEADVAGRATVPAAISAEATPVSAIRDGDTVEVLHGGCGPREVFPGQATP
jgi:hypothetical protein